MKINWKQPKYMLPLLLLPFLCLFFYTWHSGFAKPKQAAKEVAGLNGSVGDVSAIVRKKQLADKLDAYRNTYKESDRLTAVNIIPGENSTNPGYGNDYSARQKHQLDSIRESLKVHLPVADKPRTRPGTDDQLSSAIAAINNHRSVSSQPPALSDKPKDPMDVFKQQMTFMDSISKQNDPAYKEELKKRQALEKAAKLKESQVKLTVAKAEDSPGDFNTVLPEHKPDLISAVIDENITGYAGSRLRLRLLENITAGKFLIKKGTYLFAQVSGFSAQRVTLTITSILFGGKILPVKLDVYDLDGMPGLYVPSSAFRDFTKDLGGNSVQGVTIDGGSGNSQFIMSSVDKMFQSTSSAIAELIRKNKAKLKYNSYLYIIDPDALQKAQQTESTADNNSLILKL